MIRPPFLQCTKASLRKVGAVGLTPLLAVQAEKGKTGRHQICEDVPSANGLCTHPDTRAHGRTHVPTPTHALTHTHKCGCMRAASQDCIRMADSGIDLFTEDMHESARSPGCETVRLWALQGGGWDRAWKFENADCGCHPRYLEMSSLFRSGSAG